MALVSHTMKPEAEASLRAEYGYDEKLAMDSSAKLCMVAEGTADIYPRHGPTMEWDIAAAHAVLDAAGGSVTTPTAPPSATAKPTRASSTAGSWPEAGSPPRAADDVAGA